MKRAISLIAIAIAVFPISLRAQEQDPAMFLFDDFKPGTVIFRDGRSTAAPLNYNTASGTFYVKTDEETAMELSETGTIAAIVADGCFFENTGAAFYEKIEPGEGAVLYVDRRTDIFEKGKKGAYGTTSSLSNIKSVSDASFGGKRINLREAVEYSSRTDNSYYIKYGNSFRELKSMKAVRKLFQGHEEEIDRYAAENRPDFDDLEDMKKLVIFIHPFLSMEH